MKTHHKAHLHNHGIRLVSALALLIAVNSVAAPQSTDRDSPTPLTSNEIRGEEGAKGVTYYYSFTAGPGELVLTADGKVKQRSAIMNVMLFNRDAQPLGRRVSLVMTEAGVRKVERIRLANRQRIIMQLSLDDTKNNILKREYMVRLDGAIELP